MILPFDHKSGLVIVPLRLFGPGGEAITRFAVDTGATRSIVSQAIAVGIGYQPNPKSNHLEVSTVSGQTMVAELVIQQLEVLGQVRDNFPMLCSAFSQMVTVDGILGLDFLRGQRLTLDFRTGLISLD